jgi:RNA polymerase sigma-70 factor (ECF subfamily)
VLIYIESFDIEIIGNENMNNDDILKVNNNFYEKYNLQIRAIVTRILNNANQTRDIDDCVNTVYLELMEKLQLYNETRGSMGAFVSIIARSTALDYCRGNMRKNGELIGDENIDFLSGPIEFEDKVEFEMLVKNIKEKLNEQEIILFTMRYIYYYTPEEIAKVYKINRNTVDKRLGRLKSKVKNLLIKGGIII